MFGIRRKELEKQRKEIEVENKKRSFEKNVCEEELRELDKKRLINTPLIKISLPNPIFYIFRKNRLELKEKEREFFKKICASFESTLSRDIRNELEMYDDYEAIRNLVIETDEDTLFARIGGLYLYDKIVNYRKVKEKLKSNPCLFADDEEQLEQIKISINQFNDICNSPIDYQNVHLSNNPVTEKVVLDKKILKKTLL